MKDVLNYLSESSYFSSWKWRNGTPIMKSKEELEASLTIDQSEDGSLVEVNRVDIDDAPNVLGCCMSCTGSWDAG